MVLVLLSFFVASEMVLVEKHGGCKFWWMLSTVVHASVNSAGFSSPDAGIPSFSAAGRRRSARGGMRPSGPNTKFLAAILRSRRNPVEPAVRSEPRFWRLRIQQQRLRQRRPQRQRL